MWTLCEGGQEGRRRCPLGTHIRLPEDITVLLACDERGIADEWAEIMRGRIESVQDLPAADAVYHGACNTNFRTNRNVPRMFDSEVSKAFKQRTVSHHTPKGI